MMHIVFLIIFLKAIVYVVDSTIFKMVQFLQKFYY